MEKEKYKYFAFISYNSKDMEWGKRLQHKLEHYRMPATLCSEYGWNRTPIKPVFFAPTDIQPGGLNEELQERLRASKNLIVICSPNSAKSEWVGKEIEFFHQLGRTKQIHFFIVDGQPHSDNLETECFNPIVDTLGLPEILGANIHEKIYRWPWMNKERAYVQLVSKLLGVEFDAIWQRHKRLLVKKTIMWIFALFALFSIVLGIWIKNQPVDVNIKLMESTAINPNLPPMKDAIVTLILDNETKTDTICSIDTPVLFTNIPHYYLNKHVRVMVECHDYVPIDTILSLSENNMIIISRDPEVYGHVHFKLWNPNTENVSSNTELFIDEHLVKTDSNGVADLLIPLANQKAVYSVASNAISLINKEIRMPRGPNDIVIFE